VNFLSLRDFQSSSAFLIQRLKDSRVRSFSLIVAILAIASFTAFSKTSGDFWIERTINGLTLRDKIAQLIQIRVPGKFLNRHSEDYQAIYNQIRQNHVGGVVLFAGNVYESTVLLNDLQRVSKLPLLVAADFERGASFRIEDTTSFPWAMALGATGSEDFAYQEGYITARESRALGVHWIFAPVVDVNNNPNNPVINIRSFGENPDLVARLGAAFIRGAKRGGVLTTAKHFPGHGDTATDSHFGLAVVGSDMARLQSIELAPFKSAIAAGVDSIMTAHVAVPKVTGEPREPATVSSKILNDLLRDSLNFKGIVITDALEMGGITSQYWCGLAAVRAIQAGADILLLPPDATVAINEVERAVKRGDISESRINQSVRKVLSAKSRLGLQQTRTVPIRQLGEIIASPQNTQLAQDIADRSITALKDDRRLLPVDVTKETRIFSLVLSPDLESSPGNIFQAEMRKRFPSIRTAWANARISDDLSASIDRAISDSDLIVCSTFVRLGSGRNATALPSDQRVIFEKLLSARKPVIWVAFGNPYLLPLAPQIGTYLCTFSYSDVSQKAAAKALAGEIEISGRMPVSIPGYSKAGDGLTIPKLEMILKSHPEESEFSKTSLEKNLQLLNSIIEAGIFPGAELVAGHQGAIVLDQAAGKTGYAMDAPPISPRTIYDISSLSSIVAGSAATYLAAESHRLILEDPVSNYIPETTGTENGKLRIRDLMQALADEDNPGTAKIDAVEKLQKTIISRAAGVSFESFLHAHLLDPLGMKNTFYKLPQGFRGQIADSLESQNPGLLSNARDLAIFAQMLLNHGVYAHRRYFDPATVEKYSGSRGPWSQPSDSDWTAGVFSPSAYGHNSISGSLIWIDPGKKLFIVLLANGRPDSGKIAEAQRRICESVVSEIQK
jgi:beta-N-acetylhexosaminidase